MRLFVAVNLPDHVRAEVWRATEELRQQDFPVRWVKPDLIHLTLKFLGDVDSTRVPEIERLLAEAAGEVRPHSLGIGGMGAFPSVNRPYTLWVGCEPAPPLELLQHGIEQRLTSIGFAVEGRPFRPHVTVGRVKRGTGRGRLPGLAEALGQVQLSTVALATSVELMESRLGSGGARYLVVSSFGFSS